MTINSSHLLCLLFTLVLAGCNGSDKHSDTDKGSSGADASQQAWTGVYRGIALDADANPIEIQIIAESGQLPLLTVWDDREHQRSFQAEQPAGSAEALSYHFAGIQFQCQRSPDGVVCDTPEGTARLAADLSSAQHTGFVAGEYQAAWNGERYTLALDAQGNAIVSGAQCESAARFVVSDSLENVWVMTVEASNVCHLPFSQVYAETVVDNDTLYSLNFQTQITDFPQVWVKVAG
ncbi:hypothetical protein [Photobacterium sp. Hal280]|uniref:hypothetical protein n=1 Tax=Photobacterium sp. Hal280 TaxID=3035163 RepID=UPI00301DDD89